MVTIKFISKKNLENRFYFIQAKNLESGSRNSRKIYFKKMLGIVFEGFEIYD